METNELAQVSKEFINQNSSAAKIKKSARKGGPYSKNDKAERRDEVYRLYFDYGYSARKIADMMKINRNTINGDVDYWYSKIFKNTNNLDPEYRIYTVLERLEIQLTRLREQLDKVKNNSERMAIEHLMYDITSKILHTYQKLGYSEFNSYKMGLKWYNDFLEKNNHPHRNVTIYDTISVSANASQRINKIINEDKQRAKLNKKF